MIPHGPLARVLSGRSFFPVQRFPFVHNNARLYGKAQGEAFNYTNAYTHKSHTNSLQNAGRNT